MNVSGDFGAVSVDDDDPQTASLTGTVGYSRCGRGSRYVSQDGSGPCPFYLGSVHVETTEPLELDVDCDGAALSLSLDEREIDLVQPAFGIDFENSEWKAFPPGALHLRTHAKVGPFAFDRIDVNQEPVYIKALDGWIDTTAGGGLELLFDLECNGQEEPMKAWPEFSSYPPRRNSRRASRSTCRPRSHAGPQSVSTRPFPTLTGREWGAVGTGRRPVVAVGHRDRCRGALRHRRHGARRPGRVGDRRA